MQSTYRLDWYNSSGIIQAQMVGSAQADGENKFSGFTNLAYIRRVNSPGMVYVTLRGDHEILDNIANNWQVEVWRKSYGSIWQHEITGIIGLEKAWRSVTRSSFSIQCAGLLSKLADRHVSWYAGVVNRTYFQNVAAETVMKTLVDYNAGPNATAANNRLRDGIITGLSVQADGGNGNNIYHYCAYQNLLETLKNVSAIGGGDFDLVKTSPTTYEFRWYTGQLGTDRTATVIFAVDFGNMANPIYREIGDRATVAIVGGQKEGSERDIEIVHGTNYAAGNDKEIFINATDINEGDISGLQARGEQRLRDFEAKKIFDFSVTQTPHRYKIDYDLGDLVMAINPFTGVSQPMKVGVARVVMDELQGEQVTPEFILP